MSGYGTVRMGTGAPAISLAELVDTVTELPEERLNLETLRDLVDRVVLRRSMIEQHTKFCGEMYARHLLCRTSRLEALCLNWKPGQRTIIHNHGTSFGALQVHQGELQTELFERVDDGRVAGHAVVEERRKMVNGEDAVGEVHLGDIHRQGNASSTKDLVTVHFYIRPLTYIDVFDVKKQTYQTVGLRYCLGEARCPVVVPGGTGPCIRKTPIPIELENRPRPL